MPQIIIAAHGGITTHYEQDIGRGWLHNGIDQGHTNMTAYDLQIMAPADGVVTATGRQGTYGKRLVIRHDDGWRSLLAHHASQLVKVGDRVTQGQIIAVMGNTGTKYVHSHQELWDARGNQQDPLLNLIKSAGASGTTTPVTPQEEDDMFSDADRALLQQAARRDNLPVLVRTADSPKVWLSNLVTRRLVNDVDELGKVQHSLVSRGLDATVHTVESLVVFGVAVPADAVKAAL